MTVSLTVNLSDKTLSKLAEAAREQECSIQEQVALILEATMSIYQTEARDGAPTGPRTMALRKWRPAHIIHAPAPRRPVVEAMMGDPGPGRSALDQKRAAECQ